MKKMIDDITDDDIRIVGSKIPVSDDECTPKKKPLSDEGKQQDGNKPVHYWLWIIIAALLVVLALAVWKCSSGSQHGDSTLMPTDTLSLESIEEQDEYNADAYVMASDTIVNDIPLRILSPTAGKIDMHIGKLDKDNKDIILAAHAAGIRADKDVPAGAFVYHGELMSKGHSKYGFCAIIGKHVYIGRQIETPLFERAIENNGCFFRQYSIVSQGKEMRIPPKGKSIRRALALFEGRFVIIESTDRESYHDFAQALADLNVSEALALMGGDAQLMYRDAEGHATSEGTSFVDDYNSQNFIVWKK